IVVAQNRMNAKGRREKLYRVGRGLDELVPFVDEITGYHCEVGPLALSQLHRFVQVMLGHLPAAVQIGQLRDAKAVERRGQVGDKNIVTIDFEPGGLDPVAVAQAGPVAAETVSPATEGMRYVNERRSWKQCIHWVGSLNFK